MVHFSLRRGRLATVQPKVRPLGFHLVIASLGRVLITMRNHIVIATLGFCVCTPPAFAADGANRGAARELGYEGVAEFERGNFDEAADKLDRSFRALPVPSVGLWSARAYAKTGRLVEAAERYLEASRAPIVEGGDVEILEKAKRTALQEREELLPRIPRLTIVVRGANASAVRLFIDDSAIASSLIGRSIPANPKSLRVRATHDERTVEKSVTLKEAERRELTISFNVEADDAAGAEVKDESQSPTRWPIVLGWGALGVGGASLAVGAGTGIAALVQYNKLACDKHGDCDSATDSSDMQRVNTLRTASMVGFIAGGIMATTGVSLLVAFRHKRQAVAVAPYLTFGSTGIVGEF